MKKTLGQFILVAILITACSSCKKERSTGNSSTIDDNRAEIDTSLLVTSAELFYNNNDYKEAALEYKNLIKIEPANGKFYFRRAYCLLQIDSFSQARENYSKAALLKYKEAECYFSIGSIYSMEHKDSLAVVFLEKALQLEPEMEKAKSLLSIFKKNKERVVL